MLSMLLNSDNTYTKANHTTLLMQADLGVVDVAQGKTVSGLSTTPVIDHTHGKFNSLSYNCLEQGLLVGETSDFIWVPTDVFTIEWWQYVTEIYTDNWFLSKGGATTSCLKIYYSKLYLQTEKAADERSIDVGDALFAKQWQHIALVQVDGLLSLYIDGKQQILVTTTGNFGNSTKAITFGARAKDTSVSKAYFDQIRISNIARYNDEFTPSDVPWVID